MRGFLSRVIVRGVQHRIRDNLALISECELEVIPLVVVDTCAPAVASAHSPVVAIYHGN